MSMPGPVGSVPGTVIEAGELWNLLLNRNQNLLGKCLIVLKRAEPDVTRLSPAEMTDLLRQLGRVRQALDLLFQPDHYNHAFLMNQDEWVHLHMHVVPRYRAPREWEGLKFEDPQFGSLFGTEHRYLETGLLRRLTAAIAASLPA